MKISIKGIKSLTIEDQSIFLNGMTLITGANSTGKSSFLLGLRFLSCFLSKQYNLLGKNLIHKSFDIRQLDSTYNKGTFSNGNDIRYEIKINKITGLNIQMIFSPIDDFHYCLQHLEIGATDCVYSVRSTIAYLEPDYIYSFLAPIWNTLSMLIAENTFVPEIKKIASSAPKSTPYDKKPEFEWTLSHIAKFNAYNLGSEVYETNLLSKALNKFFILVLQLESFNIKTAQVICEYINHVDNKKISQDAQKYIYSYSDSTGPSNISSDFNILISSIESIIGVFFSKASKKDQKFIQEFEKTSVIKQTWKFDEKEIQIDNYKISQDSPITILSSFVADFWDKIIESSLRNIELTIYDKIKIQPKAYFTSSDEQLFGAIDHVSNQLKQKILPKKFLSTEFRKLTNIGTELIIESHISDKIKTVKVKLKDNRLIEINNLGTGHYYLTALYLKLLSFMVEIKKVDYDEQAINKSLGASAKRILLLIEPESFLHPSAQVQLADLLSYFANQGLRMVIETHSEHLIRAIQLKIAKKNITNDKVNLYYFENVNGTTIRRIRIDSRGFLLDKFGEGFIDETPKLIQEFFQVNKN